MFLSKRYEQITVEIEATAVAQGPLRLARLHSADIRLLLVSKYQSREAIYSALNYFALKNGCPPNLGENYVQGAAQRALELAQYYETNPACRPEMEMIGPLQSNKAAKAVSLFSVLHSVSSAKLLHVLEAALQKKAKQTMRKELGASDRRLDIFLQYNARHEEWKNGCRSYKELRELVDELLVCSNLLRLRGLMCMGTAGIEKLNKHRNFAACRELAERLWRDFPPVQTGGRLAPYFELSMGMSGDYREALAEGANVLRVGSLLFSD